MDTGIDPDQEISSKNKLSQNNVLIQRPIGVALLSFHSFAWSAVFLVAVFFGWDVVTTICLFFFATISFVFGFAYWRLKEWARLATIALSVLALLPGGSPSTWWARAFDLAIAFYLLSPGVKSAFYRASMSANPKIINAGVPTWFPLGRVRG